MPTTPPRPSISASMVRDAAMSRRSSLWLWMWENFEIFDEAVKTAGRPNWKALAEMFAGQGLTDSNGSPPSEECARQTWWKVRNTRKRSAKGGPPPTSESTKTAPVMQPTISRPTSNTRPDEELPPETDDNDGRRQFDFEGAQRRQREHFEKMRQLTPKKD